MERDIRKTALYQEAEALYRTLRQPGSGQISDAADIHASPDGRYAVFAGTLIESLEGVPPTRICLTTLASGDTRLLTCGPNVDRLPKFSPDGRRVAFLSDRDRAGDFKLFLLDLSSGAIQSTPRVEGWVEYLHWSPDGTRILLGVAGHGADIAGTQGAVSSKRIAESRASWLPSVEGEEEEYRWRRAWVYELVTQRVRQVSTAGSNVWEAAWCGNHDVAAVISPAPGEGFWYSARLHIISLADGHTREIFAPEDQIGCLAASPSGKHVAIVEAVSSDRWIVAGDLLIIEATSGSINAIDTGGMDVTYAEWRSEERVLLAGLSGFETVVGSYDLASGTFTKAWTSKDISSGGAAVTVSGLNETGDCVMVGEGFRLAPEIAAIRGNTYRSVKSFDVFYSDQAKAVSTIERLSWTAPDGLEIQGWLLLPKGKGAHPLVMNLHGGPVWSWRPHWLGRPRSTVALMLVKHGYAIFYPNPRGSSGRGREFARHVVGDLGGADTYDCLSGIDYLVERGVADPRRLGVTGISYGGFMTSWLTTQDSRFAAAVPVAPVSNRVSQRLICTHKHFVDLFLADKYDNPGGKYFSRSPIMYAAKVKTPTLNICGALDRCTPAEEAVQFHNALRENGVESVLATYPEEGHGVRKLPAAIDYAARVVAWFEKHMPADASSLLKAKAVRARA